MSTIRAPVAARFGPAGLASSNPSAAVRFYSDLLGWRTRGVGGVTLMRDGPVEIAAVYRQTPQAIAAGVEPHWSPFIAVSDAASAQESAVALGAVALRPPFDVAGAGTVAPIRDPVGATAALWEPAPASEATRQVGASEEGCRHVLVTEDADAASAFYAGLLGWSFRRDDEAAAITAAGRVLGAIRAYSASEAGVSGWIPCFRAGRVADVARRAEQLGARRLDPLRPGQAVLADPQGATFALVEGADAR